MLSALIPILFFLTFTPTYSQQQTCENYGIATNSSSCVCPPGFGGSTCSFPGCGGNIFQGSQRILALPSPPLNINNNSSATTYANLTQSNCNCESGWTGTGCNVCQSDQACQSAFASSPFLNSTASSSSNLNGDGDAIGGENDTLVCNTSPRIYAAGDLSCVVNNPTISSVFPLLTTLTVLRTLVPSLTPLPNVTGFGFGLNTSSANMFVQLWYAGVEQFYCASSDCVQSLTSDADNSDGVDWNCNSLQCTCRPGVELCGGDSFLDLTQTINNLTGTLTISCSSQSSSNSNVSCVFQQQSISKLLGPSGLQLSQCSFGECVRQSLISSSLNSSSSSTSSTADTDGSSSLGGGVIAGLAVVGFLLALGGGVVTWGFIEQRKARAGHGGVFLAGGASGAAGSGSAAGFRELGNAEAAAHVGGIKISWKNLTYIIPQPHTNPLSVLFRRRSSRQKYRNANGHVNEEKGYVSEKDVADDDEGVTENESIVILNNVSGEVLPGEVCAILGPSGAGKTSLIELLASANVNSNSKKNDTDRPGRLFGQIALSPYPLPPSSSSSTNLSQSKTPHLAHLPQSSPLPALLTVREALLFAARLRLPEFVPDEEKVKKVDWAVEVLGLKEVVDRRIGTDKAGEKRGISGGEMRRLSVGLEILADVDVLILDEVTSGLDSVSALKISKVLYDIAHNSVKPVAVIVSVHQPSSALYHTFDKVMLLSRGRCLYFGKGGMEPVRYFEGRGRDIGAINSNNYNDDYEEDEDGVEQREGQTENGNGERGTFSQEQKRKRKRIQIQGGYNVADFLLDIASEYVPLFELGEDQSQDQDRLSPSSSNSKEIKSSSLASREKLEALTDPAKRSRRQTKSKRRTLKRTRSWFNFAPLLKRQAYPTTFLTQFEVLAWREWKILCRDKSAFIMHVGAACILGVICGGLYFQTGITIAGFQNRVGCLFFLGALIAFSSLSALYNLVEIRSLFVRERASGYYSPTAWLFSRVIFDVVPLRIIPAIIVSSITYWMAGLAHNAAAFFKFLFIIVLYSLVMTLWNFFLACLIRNGGIAILLSALSALYQMTYAGFFVHLTSIPPVLRWLQWICPLKYNLEALSVNEVNSGLLIQDTLDGVPVDISASLIMETLFGFGANNYYRDVLILFAFIAGFGIAVIATVWLRVRERR